MPKYRIVLTPQIASDIEEAVEYSYDHFGQETALKFSGAVEAVKELIAMFPYITLEVIALSMTSQRRNPAKIKKLLSERLKQGF